MPRITCLHGHEIELAVEQFGQRIACPTCQLLITVSPPRPGEPLVPKYEVFCDNGHVLRVKSKYLGTQIRCPQCQALALVTTDRLQKHTVTAAEPIAAVLLEQVSVPRSVMPMNAPTPVVSAQALANIPVAEIDETYVKPAKRRVSNDDDDDVEEEDAGELIKAERRNLKLVDQGLGYWLGSVVGYCSIQMVVMILSFFILLIMQGVSSPSGFQTLGTISQIVGWCVFIAMLLNTLLYLGGVTLTLFMPWVTGVTIWFVLNLVLSLLLLGWVLFVTIYEKMWDSSLPTIMNKDAIYAVDKLFYFIGETILLFMWLTMMVALWQIGKYARKPLTRQRVMLMGMLGVGCWVVIVFFPLLSHSISGAGAGVWVVLIFRLLLTLGIGGLMIFQHLSVVNEVRSIMHRRR